MEEMKKDEALEEQQTTAEAAEATEAEAVQAEEIPDAVDENGRQKSRSWNSRLRIDPGQISRNTGGI